MSRVWTVRGNCSMQRESIQAERVPHHFIDDDGDLCGHCLKTAIQKKFFFNDY